MMDFVNRWEDNPSTRKLFASEFLEASGDDREAPRRELDLPNGIAQAVRLLWQMRAPEYLLTEKVVDAVVSTIRADDRDDTPSSFDVTEYPTIKLERAISPADDRFPWVAVIESGRASRYVEEISRQKGQFGIAIAIGAGRRVLPLGACTSGVGLQGSTGGMIRLGDDEFLATCAHVLSKTCMSIALRGLSTNSGEKPDAALLSQSNPCFKAGSYRISCRPAAESEIEAHIMNSISVHKTGANDHSRLGRVRNRAHGFKMNGVYHRFPHLEIIPELTQAGPVVLPLWDRAFSREGDSGSWVVSKTPGLWLGMVVGGDQFFLSTFAADAEPLLCYFSLMYRFETRQTAYPVESYMFDY